MSEEKVGESAYIFKSQAEQLEDEEARTGKNKSEIFREALDLYFGQPDDPEEQIEELEAELSEIRAQRKSIEGRENKIEARIEHLKQRQAELEQEEQTIENHLDYVSALQQVDALDPQRNSKIQELLEIAPDRFTSIDDVLDEIESREVEPSEHLPDHLLETNSDTDTFDKFKQ